MITPILSRDPRTYQLEWNANGIVVQINQSDSYKGHSRGNIPLSVVTHEVRYFDLLILARLLKLEHNKTLLGKFAQVPWYFMTRETRLHLVTGGTQYSDFET